MALLVCSYTMPKMVSVPYDDGFETGVIGFTKSLIICSFTSATDAEGGIC